MKDSQRQIFQLILLFLKIAKLTNKFAKENILKYTWKIQSSNICLCFLFSGYPTILWDTQGCSYANSCFYVKSFDYQEGKQVRHADGFQWKMFASIYPGQKIVGRCNLLVKLQDTCLHKRSMSAGILQWFS